MKTLLGYLKEDALRVGKVTLASGKESEYYIDTKQVSLYGPSLRLIGDEFWRKLREVDSQIDSVAGVSLGGDPLASSVALSAHQEGHDIQAFLIRKEAKSHGATQGGRVEGRTSLKENLKSLWLLEDVISTGASSLSAAQHLIEQGFPLKGVCCILDRDMGGTQKISEELSLPCLALYQIHDVLEGTGIQA